jgi:hypothetical protein
LQQFCIQTVIFQAVENKVASYVSPKPSRPNADGSDRERTVLGVEEEAKARTTADPSTRPLRGLAQEDASFDLG